MTTDSLDSHDIYTTVRTSWATRLTQPTEYGIADALGQDTTRQVLTRPAFAAVYLQAATVGVCDAILSRGHDHARTVIQQPRLPQPTVDDFDLTTEIPTVHQWIIDSLTGHNPETEAAISHTLTTAPNPTDAAVRHAIALLHVGSLAATPATRRADQPHTPGTADGAAQAMATLNANIAELRRLGGLPQHPKNPARTATEPRRHEANAPITIEAWTSYEGRLDGTGRPVENPPADVKLSQARAEAIRSVLTERLGVPAANIARVVGHGSDSQPDPDPRSAANRVTVVRYTS